MNVPNQPKFASKFVLFLGLLFCASSNAHAVFLRGNPFTPTDANFPNLTPDTTAGKKSRYVWKLNFGQLLSTLHLQDTSISGFLLSADMTHGERPNSDPYLLIAVGNAIPAVPEMATLFPIIGLI